MDSATPAASLFRRRATPACPEPRHRQRADRYPVYSTGSSSCPIGHRRRLHRCSARRFDLLLDRPFRRPLASGVVPRAHDRTVRHRHPASRPGDRPGSRWASRHDHRLADRTSVARVLHGAPYRQPPAVPRSLRHARAAEGLRRLKNCARAGSGAERRGADPSEFKARLDQLDRRGCRRNVRRDPDRNLRQQRSLDDPGGLHIWRRRHRCARASSSAGRCGPGRRHRAPRGPRREYRPRCHRDCDHARHLGIHHLLARLPLACR